MRLMLPIVALAIVAGCASTPPPQPQPTAAPVAAAEPCDEASISKAPTDDGRCPVEIGEAEADPFAE